MHCVYKWRVRTLGIPHESYKYFWNGLMRPTQSLQTTQRTAAQCFRTHCNQFYLFAQSAKRTSPCADQRVFEVAFVDDGRNLWKVLNHPITQCYCTIWYGRLRDKPRLHHRQPPQWVSTNLCEWIPKKNKIRYNLTNQILNKLRFLLTGWKNISGPRKRS